MPQGYLREFSLHLSVYLSLFLCSGFVLSLLLFLERRLYQIVRSVSKLILTLNRSIEFIHFLWIILPYTLSRQIVYLSLSWSCVGCKVLGTVWVSHLKCSVTLNHFESCDKLLRYLSQAWRWQGKFSEGLAELTVWL